MTRSMTISTAVNNKIEKQIPIKTSSTTVQLPDIIPSASTSIQSISIPETINNSIIIDNHVCFIHKNKIFHKVFVRILGY
jgi:hypothetical protein